MTLSALLLLALGVSADAFVVAVGRGTTLRRLDLRAVAALAVVFGGFQAAMPLAGWAAGGALHAQLAVVGHWLPAGVLLVVGALMLAGALREAEGPTTTASWGPVVLLGLGVATSLDAFAVGVGFALLTVEIAVAVLVIGVTAFVLTWAGALVGHHLGRVHERSATALGGCLLVGLGARVLLSA